MIFSSIIPWTPNKAHPFSNFVIHVLFTTEWIVAKLAKNPLDRGMRIQPFASVCDFQCTKVQDQTPQFAPLLF